MLKQLLKNPMFKVSGNMPALHKVLAVGTWSKAVLGSVLQGMVHVV